MRFQNPVKHGRWSVLTGFWICFKQYLIPNFENLCLILERRSFGTLSFQFISIFRYKQDKFLNKFIISVRRQLKPDMLPFWSATWSQILFTEAFHFDEFRFELLQEKNEYLYLNINLKEEDWSICRKTCKRKLINRNTAMINVFSKHENVSIWWIFINTISKSGLCTNYLSSKLVAWKQLCQQSFSG